MTRFLAGDALIAGVGMGDYRLAVDDLGLSVQRAHPGFLEQRADAAGEARYDCVLPGDRSDEVELRRSDRKTDRVQPVRIDERMRGVSRMDQRLRRNAADVEAGPPDPLSLDENGVEAELARANRCDIAARAAADDEDLAGERVHASLCSCAIARSLRASNDARLSTGYRDAAIQVGVGARDSRIALLRWQ